MILKLTVYLRPFDEMSDTRQQEVKECLGIIMDYTTASNDIKLNAVSYISSSFISILMRMAFASLRNDHMEWNLLLQKTSYEIW